MKKFLLLFLLISGTVYGDWKVENSKNFKGEKLTYLVSNSGNGSELWIDLQDSQIVYRHKNQVLNGVNGIKIDNVLYEVNWDSTGDRLDTIVICRPYTGRQIDIDCYKNIYNSQKVEVNVSYFRGSQRVSIFNVKSMKDTVDKFYKDYK